jgi:hypothetical protein
MGGKQLGFSDDELTTVKKQSKNRCKINVLAAVLISLVSLGLAWPTDASPKAREENLAQSV